MTTPLSKLTRPQLAAAFLVRNLEVVEAQVAAAVAQFDATVRVEPGLAAAMPAGHTLESVRARYEKLRRHAQ
jgi:hypothetical protein